MEVPNVPGRPVGRRERVEEPLNRWIAMLIVYLGFSFVRFGIARELHRKGRSRLPELNQPDFVVRPRQALVSRMSVWLRRCGHTNLGRVLVRLFDGSFIGAVNTNDLAAFNLRLLLGALGHS